MAIWYKTPEQIEMMRRAGRVVRLVLNRLGELIRPGVTTEELDAVAEKLCVENGAECLFKGYPGHGRAGPFPGSICASIDEQVVHGIPSSRKLEEGQILSVDFGVRLDGWCGDAAQTFPVGKVDASVQKLIDVTSKSLDLAIKMMTPGEKWSRIARAMQDYVEENGFSVVTQFVGHGIGQRMHEEPQVQNFWSRELEMRDIVLRPGLVLAVEPMVNMGVAEVKPLSDGWTIVTKDGKPSAHFEHTLAMTQDGVLVLTE